MNNEFSLQKGAAEAIAAVLSGEWPKSVVNPEVKEAMQMGQQKE